MQKLKLSIHPAKIKTRMPLPLVFAPVKAGFPSPAEDYIEGNLDLNKHLIEHPAATFFVRVEGSSMEQAGILSGDILIVDRAKEAKNGQIIVAVIDGAFTVKRIKKTLDSLYLLPENPSYSPIKVSEDSDFQVWGVVTYIIHKAK